MIGFITVAPVSASGWIYFDLTTSSPCACSTEAVYTFYVDTSMSTGAIIDASITIPAGYSINSAYMTSTAGIIVATGDSGNVFPYTSGNPVTVKTTTTLGTFEIFVDGSSVGTGTIVPPTQTTPGNVGDLFGGMATNTWSEVSFVAGFFVNPCIQGTYVWGPNTATIDVGGVPVDVPVQARLEHTEQVTIANCVVGGVVAPASKLEIVAPFAALAGLIVTVSAVVVAKKRRD